LNELSKRIKKDAHIIYEEVSHVSKSKI